MNVKEEKKQLRNVMINRLKSQHIKERNLKSRLICERIIASREYKHANVILFYAAMTYEVDTAVLIENAFRNNKKVLLPALDTETKEIIPCEIKDLDGETFWCKYGFKEPNHNLIGNAKTEDIECVIVPGICYDANYYRLGRGAGYYDRFLVSLAPRVATIGVGFDFQIVDSIPIEKHDFPLKKVITS